MALRIANTQDGSKTLSPSTLYKIGVPFSMLPIEQFDVPKSKPQYMENSPLNVIEIAKYFFISPRDGLNKQE